MSRNTEKLDSQEQTTRKHGYYDMVTKSSARFIRKNQPYIM